jgi:large subunit ribosomal protein L33
LFLLFFLDKILSLQSYKKKDLKMAKKGARENIKLKSTESAETYWTVKNKKNQTERLELKKYDKKLQKRVVFKEAK